MPVLLALISTLPFRAREESEPAGEDAVVRLTPVLSE
jgi:hypothetical protein